MKQAIAIFPESRVPRTRQESVSFSAASAAVSASPGAPGLMPALPGLSGLRGRADAPDLKAWWLGQAGFLFESGDLRILVDPYLSDSLAQKYRGTKYPHTRISPPPALPGELFDIDFVLVSHSHSDHLDPGTLPLIAANNPSCRFLIPESCLATALERGIPARMIDAVNSGDRLALGVGGRLSVIPSAHERLEKDVKGHFLHLGYILDLAGVVAYHSGDCVPYPGLADSLAGFGPDLAFLPVNGRDAQRTSNGIVGNFTLEEAVDLVLSLPACFGLGHHFGMFDFNTIDPAEGKRYLASRPEAQGRFALAEPGLMLAFSAQPGLSQLSQAQCFQARPSPASPGPNLTATPTADRIDP